MAAVRIGRRWLYIIHRWTGIVLCLFMALWFVSGVVMMYVGYPRLTQLERLEHLPQLSLPAACCVSPQQALQAAGSALPSTAHKQRTRGDNAPPELKLATIGDTPYWLVGEERNRQTAVHAVTGNIVDRFDEAHALFVSRRYAEGNHPTLMEIVHQDIFTVTSTLEPHRPLFRVALNDADGTEVYVSSRTGEVVRDSTRLERGWNYVGSILHYFYPLKGEFFDKWRRDIIIYTSLVGTIVAMLGVWIGVLRWRFKGRFTSGSRSPYRSGWMRWHHISGLIFGLVTITWVFSGMLSLNPWKVFETDGAKPKLAAFSGTDLDRARFALTPQEAIGRAGFPVKEIGVQLFDGRPYYVLRAGNGRTGIIVADDPDVANIPMEMIPDASLLAAAAKLMPDHNITRATRLDSYDNYYYYRQPHNMGGQIVRRLPVLRVEFDDPAHTWVHIDPYTASVFNRLDDRGRVKRWLFAFLHSFDSRGFVEIRPLWDVTLVLLSIGGFVLCVTSMVIGWRRLRRPAYNRVAQ
ncbi:MAG: Optional hypothetical component of the B12 transporter BtuN [Rhodocyclaceae bacterium]|nr:MAG: Optional hypothetical component of the B12 transporter BtuN [Rhodocyclaceae bacterium]TND02039.1 MAG: Optional hypothetical component of the B12 transporter BtuN [Rhodocyclaceae bacterium]